MVKSPVGLTVIREEEPLIYNYDGTQFKCRRIICRCTCGREFVTKLTTVKTGKTQSCGCLRGRHKNGEYRSRAPFAVKTREDPLTAYLKTLFGTYVYKSKLRKIQFKLELSEFKALISQRCFYCGAPPRSHRNGRFPWNGIDRKDNSKGYSSKNCVPCCSTCNSSKSKLSAQQFVELATRVFWVSAHRR